MFPLWAKKMGLLLFPSATPKNSSEITLQLQHNQQEYNRYYRRLWFMNLSRTLIFQSNSMQPHQQTMSMYLSVHLPNDCLYGISVSSSFLQKYCEVLFCLRQYLYHAFSENLPYVAEKIPLCVLLKNHS